ncbi:MAG: orotidine-5'-phosphate decarboxylase [Roseiflexaceae bacterium]
MPITAQERILVALDVPTLCQALQLVEQLRGRVGGFKVGLELCHSAGTNQVIDAISAAGGAVFLDIKLKDIPNTVAGATRAVSRPGVMIFNVHCDGGAAMMRAAVAAAREATPQPPLIIGVTLLTSLGAAELHADLAVAEDVESYVVRMARLAQEAGLDGVVTSAHEVRSIKRACGEQFITVTPGIRPRWAAGSDHRRALTPAQALAAGSDYLVIGRPITSPPPEIGDPAAAVERILAEIEGER